MEDQLKKETKYFEDKIKDNDVERQNWMKRFTVETTPGWRDYYKAIYKFDGLEISKIQWYSMIQLREVAIEEHKNDKI